MTRKCFYYKFRINYFDISSLPLVAKMVRNLLTVKEVLGNFIYLEIYYL